MQEQIREAKHSDLEQLLQLLYQLSKRTEEDEKADRERLASTLGKIVEDENYCVCVFESKGKLVGTGTLLVQLNLSHGVRPYGHIENIVVDAGHRKKGIGKRIVEHLTERAREKGCYKVRLGCAEPYTQFYSDSGFKKHGFEMRLDL